MLLFIPHTRTVGVLGLVCPLLKRWNGLLNDGWPAIRKLFASFHCKYTSPHLFFILPEHLIPYVNLYDDRPLRCMAD